MVAAAPGGARGGAERRRRAARRRRLRAVRLLRLRHRDADVRPSRRRAGCATRNFHTTALCSPTRACLLTGRNHHASGMARIVEFAAGFPGYDATMPKANGFLSEVLVRNGYATFAVGKWHLAPAPEMATGGRRERWPLGRGLRALLRVPRRRDRPVPPRPRARQPPGRPAAHARGGLPPHRGPRRPGHRLPQGPAGRRRRRSRSSCTSRRARATRRTRSPAEYADRTEGAFDHGWDACRASEVFARQQAIGAAPAGHRARASGRTWIAGVGHAAPTTSSRLYARMMEVYAGFLEHTDAQVGRVVDFIESARRARQHDRPRDERQRRQRRGRAAGIVQRELLLQPRAREPRGEPRAASTTSAARTPTTTTHGAGRGRATRRSGAGSARPTRAASPIR